MAIETYRPSKVGIVINGVPITGWADGDILSIEPIADQHSLHVGTGGEFGVVGSEDGSFRAVFRVMDYSRVNPVFELIKNARVAVAIAVGDKSSAGTFFATDSAYLQKAPPLVKGAEAKVNEWPFICGRGTSYHGGGKEI